MMQTNSTEVKIGELAPLVSQKVKSGARLGLITSIDGTQLVTLLLDPQNGSVDALTTPLLTNHYPSLTNKITQAHWYERALHDLFGLCPDGHPRLKPVVINEAFHELSKGAQAPLNTCAKLSEPIEPPDFSYLHVAGTGIFELPVGPVHAGIIEPAHFRLSCLGETVVNLEVRLGFLHRGIEQRLTKVAWTKARFVAEAAASDTALANALAHAVAIESILDPQTPPRAQCLRTMALEIERLAMHIADVGGMAVDLGFLSVAAAGSRLRGLALGMADLLSGSRFLRGFIAPGGVTRDPDKYLSRLRATNKELRKHLKPLIEIFLGTSAVFERLRGVGHLSHSLAQEFGIVGVAGRASKIDYDARRSFAHATYPADAPPSVIESDGDALARTLVRVAEIYSSLDLIDSLLDRMPAGAMMSKLPDKLPANATGVGIVEAFRGELLHAIFTDGAGLIKRYAIKDPSFNNWTALAIAVRNNVIADFPVCNKSFSLSYGGHDL